MIPYNLSSIDAAQRLIRVCEKYSNSFTVDVIYGRQVIDGCSLMGVMSLVGHIVSIDVSDRDCTDYEYFKREIKEIGLWL